MSWDKHPNVPLEEWTGDSQILQFYNHFAYSFKSGPNYNYTSSLLYSINIEY